MWLSKFCLAAAASLFVGGHATMLRNGTVEGGVEVLAPQDNVVEVSVKKHGMVGVVDTGGAGTGECPVEIGGFVMPRECTVDDLRSVEGYLLDLDGTMYSPSGLLEGVPEFFDYLESSGMPHVLLSNGFKTKQGVASKFASQKYKINQTVDPEKVHTAGIAMANYMEENVPKGAKVFALGTSIRYGDGTTDFLTRILKREVNEDLFNTWKVRTDMTIQEIHEWAHLARDKGEYVAVVQAFMGSPNDEFGDDPVTGKSGYSQMDYELMKKVNVLLRNNAYYFVGAPDVADSQPRSEKYPNIDTSWPTMGGMESLFLTSAEMFPGSAKEQKYHANTGKGGNKGAQYMMEPGIELLMKQKPDINRENIMIIGDNFGTDIKSGNEAGIKSMLVLVGAHQPSDGVNWSSRPTCYLPHVGKIPDLLNGPGDENVAAVAA